MDLTDGEDPGIPLTSSEARGRKLRPATAGPDERGCVRFDAIDVGDICYLGPCKRLETARSAIGLPTH